MLTFVIRRLLIAVPILIAASLLMFLMIAYSGDPLAQLRSRQPPVPPSVIELKSKELNLDKSVPERYVLWLGNAVTGDFGKDVNNNPVGPTLWSRLLITLRMVIIAGLLAVLVAMVVGVISAVRQYSALDYTSTFLGFLFLSMPVFWLAALLKEYAGIQINRAFGRQLIYTVGEQSPTMPAGFGAQLADILGHLVLPVLSLMLITYASWSRYQRASMLDVLNSDYVRLARAKGLGPRQVMVRHALRTALIPLTTIVAIDFGALFGGAVVTESVFTWQGMGRLLVDGIQRRDINVVLAWLLISGVMVVLFNLIADILYAYLDPRIRHG